MSDDSIGFHVEFDTDGLLKEIKPILVKKLEEVAESAKRHVAKEIMFAGIGHKEWKKEVASWYQEVSRKITDDLIKINLGFKYDTGEGTVNEGLYPEIETRVVMFGNNNRFTRIFAGPKGRDVFAVEVIEGPWKSSRIEKSYFLPQGMNFKQNGALIIENAFKTVSKEFQNAIDQAILSIPTDILEKYATVVWD